MSTVTKIAAILILVCGVAVAAAGQTGVQIGVSQKQYRQGETVKFVLKNGTAAAITLPNPAPWYITRNNQVVYRPNPVAQIVSLDAGSTSNWSVSAIPSELGDISKPGKYEIHLQFYDASSQSHEIVCVFQVAGS